MLHACPHSRTQRASALIAALFGLATLFAGGRILLGFAEAGYDVVRPVLVFNTAMGVLYLLTAILIARAIERGRMAARLIALANATVLVAIVVLRSGGEVVANETLAAMTLRTAVWVGIAIAVGRVVRRGAMPPGTGTAVAR